MQMGVFLCTIDNLDKKPPVKHGIFHFCPYLSTRPSGTPNPIKITFMRSARKGLSCHPVKF